MAAGATPLLRRHPIVRQRLSMRVETAREIVTFHLLEILTRRGVTFDPRLRSIGLEHFERALAEERGVLVVGPHSMLSVVAIRALHDLGVGAAVVSAAPMRILGTRVEARRIERSFTYLLEVRRLLREKSVVAAMIDRGEADSRSARAVPTALGEIVVADALLQLAVRNGTPVVFAATRMHGAGLVITLAAPSAEESTSAERVAAAFAAFLQQHVAELARDEIQDRCAAPRRQ